MTETPAAPESISYEQALLIQTREQLTAAMAANADYAVQVQIARQEAAAAMQRAVRAEDRLAEILTPTEGSPESQTQ